MKAIQYLLLMGTVAVLFVSCQDKAVNLGEVSYYPKFLWSAAKTDTLVKTYNFEFSNDAKEDSVCFARFQFVDNYEKPVSQKEMIVFVDGERTAGNTFSVNYDEACKELKFIFTPAAKSGKHQGYLKLIDHNLDRIENYPLQPHETATVFQWTIHFDKRMNPWVKGIMWVVIIVVAALLLWIILLRPIMYPHFAKMSKTVIVKQNGVVKKQARVRFTGARKVVFTNRPIKQSTWEKVFIGKTRTLIDPMFEDQLTFKPNKKSAMAIGIDYMVTPNPIPRSGITTMKNTKRNMQIQLS